MAADLNRTTLVGRLTRDPELRSTGAGTAVANIRLAFSTRQRDTAGNWEDKSNYIDVVIFGTQAENAGKYLAKGRRIGVDGRLSWREWAQQDGSKRQNIEVIADQVHYLDSVQANGAAQPADSLPTSEPVAAGAPKGPDDVPF